MPPITGGVGIVITFPNGTLERIGGTQESLYRGGKGLLLKGVSNVIKSGNTYKGEAGL